MVADELLKKYGVSGMLIGGLAKEIWSASFDKEAFNRHKDVDVLLLSTNCDQHPLQWEGGVDWWVSHSFCERPTNGTPVGLLWNVKLNRLFQSISPGLYVCPRRFLEMVDEHEEKEMSGKYRVKDILFSAPIFREFRFLPVAALHLARHSQSVVVADHCKVL
jgi:hypothetical protein